MFKNSYVYVSAYKYLESAKAVLQQEAAAVDDDFAIQQSAAYFIHEVNDQEGASSGACVSLTLCSTVSFSSSGTRPRPAKFSQPSHPT